MQVGFRFLPQRLGLDAKRVSPLNGFSRIFSISNLVGAGFGVVKLVVVASAACAVIYHDREAIAGMAAMAPSTLTLRMVELIFSTTLKVGGILLLPAVLDYLFQRWRHERDLRMTPQELREEARNLEGDRQLTSRRKQMQREIVKRRA